MDLLNFEKENLTMLVDFYEITMANGYLKSGIEKKIAYFDMFFRRVPDNGGFAIMAGVEQVVDYLKELKFSKNDIEYLKAKKIFCDEFITYLENFKFECDVWSIAEGTPIFPGEPIITVRGPVIQAQLIETMILLTVNHQSLIATKSNRIVRAAGGRAVMEFGSRRAQGPSGAVFGARAAYIGGCVGTACAISDIKFGVPALGTMAHSWVQMFESEYEAFKVYAETYPDSCTLLVDTFNVLKSGIPNAIKVFNDVLKPMGIRPAGVRIDSGDITYLSKKARKLLDDAGYPDCKICASNSLDEYIIRDMLLQGALVDSFGVGERLITASSESVFGGVYKLAAVEEEDGTIIPKIKLSENVTKITTPCFKKVWRLFDNESGKAIADVITLHDEIINDSKPYVIFDPEHIWKRKVIENFTAKPIQEKIFEKGKFIGKTRSLDEIKNYCTEQVNTLWEEVTRFENPHVYYVDLSQKLWFEKNALLSQNRDLTLQSQV